MKYIVIVEKDGEKVKYIVPSTGLQAAKDLVMTNAKCGPQDIVAAYPKPKGGNNGYPR